MFKDSNIYIKKNGLWKPVLEQGFWYLHFPGTAGSYVLARSVNDFQIGDQDAEIEVDVRKLSNKRNFVFSTASDQTGSTPYSGYSLELRQSDEAIRSAFMDGVSDQKKSWNGSIYVGEWTMLSISYSYGEQIFLMNGINAGSGDFGPEDSTINNTYPLHLGRLRPTFATAFHGDIRSFRFNDEYFDFTEGGGDTITSNKGTVLDILGDVEWRYQEPVKNVKIHTGLGWKDLVEDEGWYLHFPGDNSSYIQARDKTVFSNIPFPTTIDFKAYTLLGNQYLVGKWGTNSGYAVHIQSSRIGFASYGEGGQPYTIYSTNVIEAESKYTYEVDLDGTDLVQRLGGVEVRRDENYSMSDGEEDFYFIIGSRDGVPRPFTGDVFYLKIGDEEFLMNEGQGTTITGSKGTVMDIKGDVEWRRDNTKSKTKTKK